MTAAATAAVAIAADASLPLPLLLPHRLPVASFACLHALIRSLFLLLLC